MSLWKATKKYPRKSCKFYEQKETAVYTKVGKTVLIAPYCQKRRFYLPDMADRHICTKCKLYIDRKDGNKLLEDFL